MRCQAPGPLPFPAKDPMLSHLDRLHLPTNRDWKVNVRHMDGEQIHALVEEQPDWEDRPWNNKWRKKKHAGLLKASRAPNPVPIVVGGIKRCGKKLNGDATKICMLPAGYKTDHPGYQKCVQHGGNFPGMIRAATYEEIIDLTSTLIGDLVPIDPDEALLNEVWRTNGMINWLLMILNRDYGIEDFDVVESFDDNTRARTFLDYLMREREHLVKVSVAAIGAGIAERRVRIAEKQGEIVARAFMNIMNDLGLSPEQQQLAPGLFRQYMSGMSAPSAIEAHAELVESGLEPIEEWTDI